MITDTEPTRTNREHAADDEQLVMYLEPDQLVTDKSRPIPRAPLSKHANAALWALRVFALIVSAMVIYTFVSQLGS
jgi:hypothetical protein